MLPIQIADNNNNRRARPRRYPLSRGGMLLTTLASLIAIFAMTACTDKIQTSPLEPSHLPDNFPVVEQFAIDQAGSRISVTFELPDARDNGILRPVFIGFRAINAGSDGTNEMLQNAMKLSDYLHTAPLPVKILLWRIDNNEKKPVVLSDMHWDMNTRHASWHLHPDEKFTHHRTASTDNHPLIKSGNYDFDRAYYIHGFARIIPPTPGHYRLEVESLESHPTLAGLKSELPALHYELLVSHYYQRNIE